jgi:Histidine kinase
MNLHELTFNNGRYRFLRHFIFWLCWLIFSAIVQLTNIKPGFVNWGDLVLFQLLRALTRIPSHIVFCYVTVYYLVPKFIPDKKYKLFFLSVSLFAFILYWLNYFLLTPIYHLPGSIVGGEFGANAFNITPFIRKFFAFYSNINFTGAIPACCLMLAIKYYKDWYTKQRESEMLQRENKLAELQLLKAQIHPHFLFNTLNNIYSFTLTGSPQAADLVDKLSGMIDYMITEGERSFVPVEKEIQLINDYIGLEKVRYGDRLEMQVSVKGNYRNKMIAPLLMIPFVENCFKHGASVMRGQQWIRLDIIVKEDRLDFKLSNSKPPDVAGTNNKKGIGLTNVQKRLQLIYPGKYFLKTESTSDSYLVHLQVNLQQFPVSEHANKTALKLQPI